MLWQGMSTEEVSFLHRVREDDVGGRWNGRCLKAEKENRDADDAGDGEGGEGHDGVPGQPALAPACYLE